MPATRSLARLLSIATILLMATAAGPVRAAISIGDLIVVDSHNGNGTGALIDINPATGSQSVISSGGLLRQPVGICRDPSDGSFLVADFGGQLNNPNGQILRITPTGQQSVAASGGSIVHPTGVQVDSSGNLIVAQEGTNGAQGAVLLINPSTANQFTIASGQHLSVTENVIVGPHYFVANYTNPSAVVSIDSAGNQSVVSTLLNGVEDLCEDRTHPGTLLVAVTDNLSGKYSNLYRVDETTGSAQLLSSGGLLTAADSVTQSDAGAIYMANTIIAGGTAGIVQIDPQTGAQTLITSGGNLITPSGVVVAVPEPATSIGGVVGVALMALRRRR